jgi:hypothetical protein
VKYKRGSVIRQEIPHPEHPHGARRWRVLGVRRGDYFVYALFHDDSPRYAYWNIAWCDEVTELEWQDDAIGRIDERGQCTVLPSRRKATTRKVRHDGEDSAPPD